MRKYVIMGVQGSGKGTQAKLLCRHYDLVHISVGDAVGALVRGVRRR